MAKGKYQEWLTDEGLLKLEGWARRGLTDADIAHNMGINVGTLYKYKNLYSEINDALKTGKEVADILVENALFKRAIGYTVTEITEERVFDHDEDGKIIGPASMEVTKRVTKEVTPDVTAQIFWLKNRRPDLWRDKRDFGVEGSVDVKNNYDELTVEELRALARECMNEEED